MFTPSLVLLCMACNKVQPGIHVKDSKGICWDCAEGVVDVWLDSNKPIDLWPTVHNEPSSGKTHLGASINRVGFGRMK